MAAFVCPECKHKKELMNDYRPNIPDRLDVRWDKKPIAPNDKKFSCYTRKCKACGVFAKKDLDQCPKCNGTQFGEDCSNHRDFVSENYRRRLGHRPSSRLINRFVRERA